MNESLPREEIDVRRGRRNLLALFAIALVPVLIAMVMYFAGVGVPEGRTNKGELLEPLRPIPTSEWRFLAAEREWQMGPESGWKLIFAGAATCDEPCMQLLHHARQTHIALGRETSRVKRYYLALGAAPAADVQEMVHERFPGFEFLVCAGGEPVCAVAAEQPALYLADPLGNLVLRYTLAGDRRALLDDLKRLLKVSRIG